MSPRTITRLYWSFTILFCLLMLADGAAGLLLEKNGQQALRQLGYPSYLMVITGAAKILGALALLQPRYRTLKEWAFAGFTINFSGAAASVALAGLGLLATLPALVMTAVLFGLYALWKRYLGLTRPAATGPSKSSVAYAPAAV